MPKQMVSNPFKRERVSKGTTLPIPFLKTHDMLHDTIDDVAQDTVFKQPIWTFSGLKLENFCKNLLRKNKKKIVKSSSVENLNCLNGCFRDDEAPNYNSVGRSRKKFKKNGNEEIIYKNSKKLKNSFRSQSKTREKVSDLPPMPLQNKTSTSIIRQPFRAIPNDVQKLDKEPKRRSNQDSNHSFSWTQQPNTNQNFKIHSLDKSPYKPHKRHSDNAKYKENSYKLEKKFRPLSYNKQTNFEYDGSQHISPTQIRRTFGRNPIILKKTTTTTKTTTAVISQKEDKIAKKLHQLLDKPRPPNNNKLLALPPFGMQDYREIKKRAKSVELTLPRKNRDSSGEECEAPRKSKMRARSVTRRTNVYTITTRVEECYRTKSLSDSNQQKNTQETFSETYKCQNIILSTTDKQKTFDEHSEINLSKHVNETFEMSGFNEEGRLVTPIHCSTPIHPNEKFTRLDAGPAKEGKSVEGTGNLTDEKLEKLSEQIVSEIFKEVLKKKKSDEEGSEVSEATIEPSNQVLLEQTCALSYFDGLKWVPIQTSEEIQTKDGVIKRSTQLEEFTESPKNILFDDPPIFQKTNSKDTENSEYSVDSIEGYLFNDVRPPSPTSSATLVASSAQTSPTLVPSSPLTILHPSPPTLATSKPLNNTKLAQAAYETSLTSPIPEFSPQHNKVNFKNTLFESNRQTSLKDMPCVNQITTHDYGEMFSFFYEIPQQIIWLKARILTQYDTKDPFYHHILTNCSELRPSGWEWLNRFTVDSNVFYKNKKENRPSIKTANVRGLIGSDICTETQLIEITRDVPIERFTLLLFS